MLLTDTVTVSGTRRTADGYLVADARVARTGIQEYLGVEVGKPEMMFVRVYRPEEAVFANDAMRTYAFRPMTNDHPSEEVTADNWRKYAIGQTGGEVVRDGEYVRVPMVLMDAQAIADYESGKRELSMGYSAEIEFRDGVTPDGQKYDAIQTNLKMNHLALVDRARGGAALRIGDDNPKGKKPMSDVKTKTVLVDGLSVETTDAGAQAISKLQDQLKTAQTEHQKLADEHAKALAAKDAEIAKKDAAIDDLKAKQMTDAQIDERVKARADLVATAKLIADGDYSGKSDADIRKAVVLAKFGDAMKDKPDAYIAARFDILAEDAAKDPVRKALADSNNHSVNDAAAAEKNAHAAYLARLNNRKTA